MPSVFDIGGFGELSDHLKWEKQSREAVKKGK